MNLVGVTKENAEKNKLLQKKFQLRGVLKKRKLLREDHHLSGRKRNVSLKAFFKARVTT